MHRIGATQICYGIKLLLTQLHDTFAILYRSSYVVKKSCWVMHLCMAPNECVLRFWIAPNDFQPKCLFFDQLPHLIHIRSWVWIWNNHEWNNSNTLMWCVLPKVFGFDLPFYWFWYETISFSLYIVHSIIASTMMWFNSIPNSFVIY